MTKKTSPAYRASKEETIPINKLHPFSGSVPSTPYTTNEKGQGPAWANSLFEDFCEFGLGMELANEKMRKRLEGLLQQITVGEHAPAEAKEIAAAWIANQNDAEKTKELAPQIMAFVEQGIKETAWGCCTHKMLRTSKERWHRYGSYKDTSYQVNAEKGTGLHRESSQDG